MGVVEGRPLLKRNLYLLILANLTSVLILSPKVVFFFFFSQIMICSVNKIWHITNGLIFTFIEKENCFIFIFFLLPVHIYIQLRIYNWNITGMHVINTGLK